MSNLNREALAHYIKPIAGELGSEYYLIGKDIDDMSVEMNGSFETKKNILGETSVTDTGYSPSMAVAPYYANPADTIYPFVKDLAMNRKSGDDCKAKFLEVIVSDTKAESHEAWEEDCKIEIVSYGGPTEGFAIPFTIHPCGNRKQGTVTLLNKVPTFTPTEG